jgi:hypothetical protein
MYNINTRSFALEFLRHAGTKVAVQVGHEGVYVYVEKGDFIKMVLTSPQAKDNDNFINYDGTPEPAFVEANVLHLPCGVM